MEIPKVKTEQERWDELSQEEKALEYILPNRTYDQFFKEGKDQAKLLEQYFKKEDVILEYGVGVGRILKFLKAKRKYGLDTSSAYLKRITDDDIIKIQTKGERIEIDENSVDFIYSIMVFQHIPLREHHGIIKELFRLLKPNGTLLIQFPKRLDKFSSYYKDTVFVNTYNLGDVYELVHYLPKKDFRIFDGNLVGYGENGSYKPKDKLEWFLEIKK